MYVIVVTCSDICDRSLKCSMQTESRPVGWSENGGFFFKEVELPKAGGLGPAIGVQVGDQGAKPPDALKFTSLA